MRSRQKHSLFKSSLIAVASLASLPAGSMVFADQAMPAAQTPMTAAGSTASVSNGTQRPDEEIASLPRLPSAIDSLPIKTSAIQPIQTVDLRDTVVLNNRSFGIPFNVDNAQTLPVEVHLYVSRGKAAKWKLLDRKPTSVKEFRFNATQDGTYWFATRTVDAAGNANPATQLSPQLRVFVDTTKPTVALDVQADASGRIQAAIGYEDQTPIKSIQMHYATDTLREWTKLDVRQALANGGIGFTPQENWQQLSLQIIVTDSANNRTIETKLTKRPRVASGKTPDFAAIEADDSGLEQNPIQLVAGNSDSTQRNIFVHRATEPNGLSTSEPSVAVPTERATAATDQPDAKVAQVPTTPPTAPRFSPQPVENSFFNTPHYGTAANTDPRRYDPRSLQSTQPRSQSNHFGANNGPIAPSFGPPSIAGNQKQYQLVRPRTETPNPTVIPDPASIPNPAMAAAVPSNASPQITPGINQNSPLQTGMQRQATVGVPPNQLSLPQGYQRSAAANPMSLSVNPPVTNGYGNNPQTNLQSTSPPNAITLPPASTPEQITSGFGGLNTPMGQQTFAAKTSPEQAASGPTGDSSAAAQLSIDREAQAAPKPRTLADAFRPIENSAESNRPPTRIAPPKKKPIDVDSPAYRAMRQSQAAYDQARLADRAVVRYSDSERFSLEYELEAIGAGGAQAVELYGSTDAGRTWKRWGNDPDLVSPFDIETKGEGTFAFKIVVISRNGLASPRPLPSETPDIVVIVDKSKPNLKITDVKYGEAERTGSLVIRYDCSDDHPTQRPISLAFSDSLDGPWTTIAAGLRNEGDYVWPGDPELPRQLYLRIDAKDMAGNVASYLLQEPIDSQGLAPRARIRGFRSLGENGFTETPGQTANRPKASFK